MRWSEQGSAGAAILLAAFSAVAAAQALPATVQPLSAPPAPAMRFVVVLDAAHGGSDNGASLAMPDGASTPEKDVTLALSVRLRSLLTARGMRVVTTRESDVTLDSEHRAEIANQARAQACLILHAATSGVGVHLFLSALPPAQRTMMVSWTTAQAGWVQRSDALAKILNSALAHSDIPVTVGLARLPDLDSMTCPAVAVEVVPEHTISAQANSMNMDDSAYLDQVAQALAAGLLEWQAGEGNP